MQGLRDRGDMAKCSSTAAGAAAPTCDREPRFAQHPVRARRQSVKARVGRAVGPSGASGQSLSTKGRARGPSCVLNVPVARRGSGSALAPVRLATSGRRAPGDTGTPRPYPPAPDPRTATRAASGRPQGRQCVEPCLAVIAGSAAGGSHVEPCRAVAAANLDARIIGKATKDSADLGLRAATRV